MLSLPRTLPSSPLRGSGPRLPKRTTSIRPHTLQLISPTNPRSASLSARLSSSLSSPPPPTPPSASPTFGLEVRSPRHFLASPISPGLKTVTQATYREAEQSRREARPTISLQMHLVEMLDPPYASPQGTPTPRSTSTRTPKRVAISPVVMVASPRALPSPLPGALGGKREVLDIVRGKDLGVEEADEEEKYTLNMRRGTPVTTPCVETFEDV